MNIEDFIVSRPAKGTVFGGDEGTGMAILDVILIIIAVVVIAVMLLLIITFSTEEGHLMASGWELYVEPNKCGACVQQIRILQQTNKYGLNDFLAAYQPDPSGKKFIPLYKQARGLKPSLKTTTGITAWPTWYNRYTGQTIQGVQDLKALDDMSHCSSLL